MKRLADAASDADTIHAAFLPEGMAQVEFVSRSRHGAPARLRTCLPRRVSVEACAIA
jgi:hypothetical protein